MKLVLAPYAVVESGQMSILYFGWKIAENWVQKNLVPKHFDAFLLPLWVSLYAPRLLLAVFERTRDFEVRASRSSVSKTERGMQGFAKISHFTATGLG